MRTRSRTTTTFLALLAALALLAGACGDDDSGAVASSGDPSPGSSTTAAPESAFPVTLESGGRSTTIDARPEAIVSLSPTGTEMLFALGAGEQVVATDSFSDYPPEAPTTDLSAYDPNVEAIIANDPDLVVLSDDRNDIVAGLDAVGVPSLLLSAVDDLDGTYAQIELLGQATGNADGAAELTASMRADIDELVSQVPTTTQPLTYYHELDDTLYTVTSDTFIGQIYALAGLENVADAADPKGESFGYPQLSAEYLIDADPDLVFLADTKCCGQDLQSVAARPGFGQLTAVQNGDVYEVDDDIASRWGPRVVDFLRVIVDATTSAAEAKAA